MANITAVASANLGTSLTRDAFANVRKCVSLFGAVSAIVLGTVAAMALTHHQATSFMWVRGGILLAVAPLLRRYVTKASEGSYQAFDRVRTLATIMPVALVAVDLVPGLCPAWYAVLQGLSALALVAVAVITRGTALKAAFPEK
ncbi:hypothetical protein [Streptacidiphilus albus]|uniref:hypothetical protein n=1 Tax=Streptacidiphilus albus TaxID=105425 RepID=UPI00054B5614|nr:hypothetical protein [Streptacidiphilus albus]